MTIAGGRAVLNPTAGQRHTAWVIALLLLGSCASLPWFWSNPVNPGVLVLIVETALALTAFLVAWLLYLQFLRASSTSLLWLAAGFLFVSLTTLAQAIELSLGRFLDTRLVFLGDLALPLAVIAYLLRRQSASDGVSPHSKGARLFRSIGGTLAVAVMLIWALAATDADAGAPPVDDAWRLPAVALLLTASATPLVMLWDSSRLPLDRWLQVMLLSWALGSLWLGSGFASLYAWFGVFCVLLVSLSTPPFAVEARRSSAEATVRAIANEINQPLFAISINADAVTRMLAAEKPDLEEVKAALADIGNDTLRISQALAGAQRSLAGEHEAPADIDVAQLLDECVTQLRGEMSARSVACEVETAPHLPEVRGVRPQLLQMLVNLVSHSLEAMSAAGTRERRLRMRASRRNGGSVEISVEDSGLAIPQRTGLRLAICRSIVDAHGGDISVAAESGRGVAFKVVLPASS
jgi:signal transduction histidine kinase